VSFVDAKNVVRTFCLYDFFGLGLFALPILNAHQIQIYSALNQWMGGAAIDAPDPFGLLAIYLLGALVVAWALWRWQNTSPNIAAFEGALRFVYGPILLWFGTKHNMPIMTVAGVADVIIGLLHFYVARRGGWRPSLRMAQSSLLGNVECN
jgi:uncharacterized membrane protein